MSILLAFKFLTILPVPVPDEVSPKTMGRAVAYYPLVGAVLGAFLVGADSLFGLIFPPPLRAALVLALWVALTGALHLDGFLDCCDGLLAPRPPEERLAILRDVHAGSFAVVGAVMLLLVKYAALASLDEPLRLAALVGAPVLGRWAMAYALFAYPYARKEAGLGGMVKQAMGAREMAIATAVALGASLVGWRWLGVGALAALPGAWAFTALLARWIMTRIPGLTGDAYGAICELVEVGALVVAVA